MSGAGGDWVGDFAGDWPDQPPAVPPQVPASGGAREVVEIVICPKCKVRDVRCTKRTQVASHWSCPACFMGWKEGPDVGRDRVLLA